ncbi:MAG: hypothetical protein JRI46_09030 [Deltaproteobacteria bacterium]|nr:hypothetical protein [Deltaproteobacteria bacterium]
MAELNEIEGVLDSLIYNRLGELVIPQLQYKDERIARLGREVAFCFAFLEKMQKEIDFIELIYEGRRIIVRISYNFFILVICEEKADIPLIKLTINVINEEIKGDKAIQRLLHRPREKRDLLLDAQKESEWRELLEKMNILS